MNSIQIFEFSAFILIGVSLGLIGGGGSILTLPVLVYLLGFSPVLCSAYSLFIVGCYWYLFFKIYLRGKTQKKFG